MATWNTMVVTELHDHDYASSSQSALNVRVSAHHIIANNCYYDNIIIVHDKEYDHMTMCST